MSLVKYRIYKILILLGLSVIASAWLYYLDINLLDSAFYSGWTLFIIIILGFVFSAVKEMPFYSQLPQPEQQRIERNLENFRSAAAQKIKQQQPQPANQ